MAEKDAKSKFKSKWNRVFKEKEEHEVTPEHTNSFKLEDDVADFLKPSTDKAAGTRPAVIAPKIDIAVAQRWPSGKGVRTPSGGPFTPNGYTKPPRRRGLAVGFVETEPEYIAEGGDEAEEATIEVSRRKALMARSASERRPGGQGLDTSLPSGQKQGQAQPAEMNENFEPQPLRRAQTSHNEYSAPIQKQMSPPRTNVQPNMPILSRTPTGFSSQDSNPRYSLDDVDHDEDDFHSNDHKRESIVPLTAPRIDTKFAWEQSGATQLSDQATNIIPPMSPRTLGLTAAKNRELASGEGMILRRASAMIKDPDFNEQQKRQSLGMGLQLPPQHYDTLSRSDAPNLMPEVPEPRSALLLNSALSPSGPSPFADPKYIKRHSHENTPDIVELPAEPIAQDMAQQSSSENQHPQPDVRSDGRSGESDRATNMRPPSSSNGSQGRIPSTQLQTTQTLPQRPRSRDPSPLSAPPEFLPPSPAYIDSRTGSRGSGSPNAQQHSAGSNLYPSPVTRFPGYAASPQNGSPRSSIYDKPSGSPLSSALSPASGKSKYFVSPMNKVGSPQEDPSSKPSSSGSIQAPQLPPIVTNPPNTKHPVHRPVQSRSGSASLLVDRSNAARPTSASPDRLDYRNDATQRALPQSRPTTNDRPDSGSRSSNIPTASKQRPTVSAHPSIEGSSDSDAAYADFAARVAHMKGVFRLTVEKERPADRCSTTAWLRTAAWWYLCGKSSLETQLRQRKPDAKGQPRELLTQPHVDLAKAWWILSDVLQSADSVDASRSSATTSSRNSLDVTLSLSMALLESHMKSLSLSMKRNMLMPPAQSLIQGQDTTIWLDAPPFSGDVLDALRGSKGKRSADPLDALPLGDTKAMHCYGRFLVEVYANTDDPRTDRKPMLCILTMLRNKQDFGNTIVIASQAESINIIVGPWHGKGSGVTWYDVTWKTNSYGMTIKLSNNLQATVRIQEKDFRSLYNLLQYAHKVEDSLRHGKDETQVYEAALSELQYVDSSDANAFPRDKVIDARAYIFERWKKVSEGGIERKLHRGYRLVLVTGPKNKSLAYANHEVCKGEPLYFEFITDSEAGGLAAMVVRIHESSRECRGLLVFPDAQSRQDFYDMLNGITLNPGEGIAGKMSLTSLNVEPAKQVARTTQEIHSALQGLQWQKLGVNHAVPQHFNDAPPSTVHSESLRIVARHDMGCITDRVNLGKGELLLRLPCVDTPAIQVLRNPQEDMTISIDSRNSSPGIPQGMLELMHTIQYQPTIRTYTLATYDDLHSFQAAITGSEVRYDGLASTFSISRRRMVVPIYKKWEASNVRLQLISHGTVVQILAFMEDFTHTDAMCFQVKSTDVFENIKGDGKGKKWAVKLVDAKFSLPHIPDNHNDEGKVPEEEEARVRRRFVNLEGLEYAEEHDDVVVGFESQDDRDRFAAALPATATVGRGITLKRRT